MKLYPTFEEALFMHEELMRELGGSGGLRNSEALELALLQPQIERYYYELVGEAAVLMASLAQNRPFVDGNKLVAFFVTDTFLRMNGHYIDCDNEAAYAFLSKIFESDRIHRSDLEDWLIEHVRDFS